MQPHFSITQTLAHTFTLQDAQCNDSLLLATNKLSRTNRRYLPSSDALQQCYAPILPAGQTTSELALSFSKTKMIQTQKYRLTSKSHNREFLLLKVPQQHTSKLWNRSCGGMQSAAVNSLLFILSGRVQRKDFLYTISLHWVCQLCASILKAHLIATPISILSALRLRSY